MKKTELKEIIKECVREVIFEDGMLSNLVKEVATGLNFAVLNENKPQVTENLQKSTQTAQEAAEIRAKVVGALGLEKKPIQTESKLLKNKELAHLFEGTAPLSEDGKRAGDTGVNIGNIPGAGNWGLISQRQKSGT